MRIERTSNAPRATATPAAPARVAPAASVQESFTVSAEDAALALQIEEEFAGTGGGNRKDPKKPVLSTIDDIAARASLNIVERKKEPGPKNT